jgi:sulfoxide reductase heme-binding subunit YedZ
MRLSGRSFVLLFALVGIVLVYATGQIAPADSDYQAQMRIWLAARATGIAALLLLTAQVFLGLMMSHPANSTIWRLSKRIFPWHENLLVFTLALLVMHIVGIILDPYAGVGIAGSFVPGLSSFRTAPVALGTLGLYALLLTGLTARYTKLLPAGWWLKLHRLSALVLALAWTHGLLAGTDSDPLRPIYAVSAGLVIAAAMHRYWVTRRARVAPQRPALVPATIGVTER